MSTTPLTIQISSTAEEVLEVQDKSSEKKKVEKNYSTLHKIKKKSKVNLVEKKNDTKSIEKNQNLNDEKISLNSEQKYVILNRRRRNLQKQTKSTFINNLPLHHLNSELDSAIQSLEDDIKKQLSSNQNIIKSTKILPSPTSDNKILNSKVKPQLQHLPLLPDHLIEELSGQPATEFKKKSNQIKFSNKESNNQKLNFLDEVTELKAKKNKNKTLLKNTNGTKQNELNHNISSVKNKKFKAYQSSLSEQKFIKNKNDKTLSHSISAATQQQKKSKNLPKNLEKKNLTKKMTTLANKYITSTLEPRASCSAVCHRICTSACRLPRSLLQINTKSCVGKCTAKCATKCQSKKKILNKF